MWSILTWTKCTLKQSNANHFLPGYSQMVNVQKILDTRSGTFLQSKNLIKYE
jgi:hypothetical protein